ncbi:MAG: WbuC family cupin fold metalloprotein [Desulfobulbaceae bacterium]|nr:WbuC family cupin fold metalloprotein [Desulfobulbaceae bacterium]HIJ77941.1 WbuC family cupin fold metalloprotein [Deltaproteobacteria bacterium]
MKLIDCLLYEKMRAEAEVSARKRVHYCLHASADDAVQRLVVAMEPGTYIRPHRHADPLKWELFIALKGRAAVLVFDGEGVVRSVVELAANGAAPAVEIPAGAWHTLIIKEPGTLLVEVKPGPYQPLPAEDFARWAPPEGDPAAIRFEQMLHRLAVGAAVNFELLNAGKDEPQS